MRDDKVALRSPGERTFAPLTAQPLVRRFRLPTIAFIAAIILTPATRASAQTQSAEPTSTLAGVYTPAQAERGKITYAGMCKACHSPASHTGPTFEKWWKGRSVAALFAYMSSQMPKSNPGSMNPDEYADVVAYLLKMNAMPTGTTELAADSTSLAT
ncbi:MAG: cytochrome c, partial [bacterium]